ncbi:PH domain-containing protein [Desulfovibrio sulfodismutans]|uniref:PH domain-containing protein n=1 Tax=Desulfolutivibrio sulfodismutans TaxID=63561 RepID=A0A7K3NRU5_9BACT|nr:PH domain-containing protein [Desulfolutivibrio sulfodismutans]NDY58837.1 PH domain-containing protein [Desulfolutivibrio sulfodismutans]QLA11418.1 PH domain-containing protein [Desulfolutivibrio sulfodismutans DSM 3696]
MSLNRLVYEGEEIRFRTGKHWVVFAKAAIFLLLAVAAWSSEDMLRGLLTFKAPEEIEKFLPRIISVTIWVIRYSLFFIFGLMAFLRLFSFFTLRVAVTPKRLICDDAVFGSFSMDLTKIESVKSEPGLFGGLFGYGKVVLTATSSQRLIVTNLNRPHVFEKELFAAK